jgi:hypothetical protein
MKCPLCGFIWPLPEQRYDIPELPDDEQGLVLFEILFYELAGCSVVQPLFPKKQSGDHMKSLFKRTVAAPIDPSLLCDGWKDAPVSSDPDRIGAAPLRWLALSMESRRLVYHVLLLAAADGATRANPYPAWYLLRSFSRAPEDFGVTGPEADKLRGNFVADQQARAKWAQAELEVTNAGCVMMFLADALHRLTSAGSLLRTLTQRRDELTGQINVLEARLGVTAEREAADR